MGDDLQSATVAIAAIAILFIVAGMVKSCAVSPHRTSQNMVPRDRRRLTATVDLVPLSAVPIRQVNHGRAVIQGHRQQAHHHLHPVHLVASHRNPPPAYPAHHLDAPFDGVVYGNTGRPVDVLPVPFPPSYDRANPHGSDQSI